MPRRGRRADGRHHAAALAAGVHERGGCGTRRRAGARAPARRGPGRVSRHARRRGRRRRALSASRRVAGARPQRGVRPALPVSRVESRRAGHRRRDAIGAADVHARQARAPSGVSDARGGRLRLGLHGPAGNDARFRAARVRTDARHQSRDRQDARRVQLGADPGRRDRLGAQLDAALDRHAGGLRRSGAGRGRRLAASLRRQGAALRSRDDELRHALRRDPATDQERRNARLRADHLFRRAIDGADPAEQRLPPGERQRADGRHEHDVLFHRVER